MVTLWPLLGMEKAFAHLEGECMKQGIVDLRAG